MAELRKFLNEEPKDRLDLLKKLMAIFIGINNFTGMTLMQGMVDTFEGVKEEKMKILYDIFKDLALKMSEWYDTILPTGTE